MSTAVRRLWLINACLAFVASLVGIINPDIYKDVVEEKILPGAFGQDIISLFAALLLGLIAIRTRASDYKKNIIGLGILGYLFYAYGIYVIERAYNVLYLLYMAIFALSFWGMIYTLMAWQPPKLEISSKAKNFSLAVAVFQPALFYPLWIFALIPLMRTGHQIDSLYSIYILDLVFVMPAFLIAAWKLRKGSSSALYVMPAIFILGFTLIFSLAVSEVAKLHFGQTPTVGALVISICLSLLFLAAAITHLKSMREIAENE